MNKILFCNNNCYHKYRAENKKERNLPKNTLCKKCGNAFYTSPGHKKNDWGMYCSMKCRPLPRNGGGIGGTRADIGIYVRSSWEANYARYLNWLKSKGKIKDWFYEPDTFYFEDIKRGVRSYTPDFKVFELNGDYSYHEVKGYMDQKSKTKLSRMQKYYPNEKIVLICNKEMCELKKISRLIKGWESNKNDKLGSYIDEIEQRLAIE